MADSFGRRANSFVVIGKLPRVDSVACCGGAPEVAGRIHMDAGVSVGGTLCVRVACAGSIWWPFGGRCPAEERPGAGAFGEVSAFCGGCAWEGKIAEEAGEGQLSPFEICGSSDVVDDLGISGRAGKTC